MLGKLLKYEFKSTSRLLGIIYVAILIMSLVLGFSGRGFFQEMAGVNTVMIEESMETAQAVPFMILTFVYMLLIMALVIFTFVAIIERFYHNLLKGEGYLMHTLPVPTWMLVASKTICAFVWEILGVAVVFASLLIMLGSSGIFQIFFREVLPLVYKDLIDVIHPDVIGTVVLVVVDAIFQAVRMILVFYVSMAIGGAAKKHKKLFSVIAFIVIMIIMEIIDVTGNLGQITALNSGMFGVFEINMLLVKDMIANVIYAGIFFALTTVVLKRRLNLE